VRLFDKLGQYVFQAGLVFVGGRSGLVIARSKSSFAKRLLKYERASVGIVDFDLKRGFLQHLGMRGVATGC
jgi:hypothetical protein